MSENNKKTKSYSIAIKISKNNNDDDTNVDDPTENYGASKEEDLEKPFKCGNCKYATTRKANLKQHQAVHSIVKLFKCEKCTYETANKHYLSKHKKIHSAQREKPFKCNKCAFASTTNYVLKMHKTTHSITKPYKCEQCTFATAWKYAFENHKKNHLESNERPFKCSLCSYATVNQSKLASHQAIHSTDRQYKCRYCTFASAHKNYLGYHEKRHTGHTPYQCSSCDAKFVTKGELNQHAKIHNAECKGTHKCAFCEKAFFKKSGLERHERIHNGHKPFSCDICGSAFNTKGNLKEHERVHTREKRFKCSKCDYSSDLRYNMSQHELNHKEQPARDSEKSPIAIRKSQKSHQCLHCHNYYGSKQSLCLHIRTHTGEKPYRCPRCECAFIQTSGMKKHEERHRNQKRCKYCKNEISLEYRCKNCSYECNTMAVFMKHLTSNHFKKGRLRKNLDSVYKMKFTDCFVRIEKLPKEQMTLWLKNGDRISQTIATMKRELEPTTNSWEQRYPKEPRDEKKLFGVKDEPMNALNYVQLSTMVTREDLEYYPSDAGNPGQLLVKEETESERFQDSNPQFEKLPISVKNIKFEPENM